MLNIFKSQYSRQIPALTGLILVIIINTGCDARYGVQYSAMPTPAPNLTNIPIPTQTPNPQSGTASSPRPSSTPTPTATAVPTPVPCTPKTITENIRLIFMIDNSGSTADTDPNYSARVSTIQTFLKTYQNKANFTYAFGIFGSYIGGNAYSGRIGVGAGFYDMAGLLDISYFANTFGSAAALPTILNNFENRSTDGGTLYTSAFTALQTLISQDERNHRGVYKYVVIFMSDGEPTDWCLDSTCSNVTFDTVDNGVTALVDKLKASVIAGGSSFALSTVYFDATASYDDSAAYFLSDMANHGGGTFIDAHQSGQNFTIDDLLVDPGCH